MRLWLQADRGYIMGAGGALSVWQDQSPLHKNVTQTTIGQQPVVVANQINGQPVVRFDGTNDYFDLPNPMAGATAGEVFVMLKVAQDPSAAARGLWLMGGDNWPEYQRTDGQIAEDWGSTTLRTIGNPVQPLNQYHLYNVSSKSGEWAARINGNVLYQTATNAVTFYGGGGTRLGKNYGEYFAGDIAEIMIYDHVLTSLEREAVGQYMTQKYALVSMPVPDAPTSLAATAISPTQAEVSWVAPSGAVGMIYTLERQIGAGAFTQVTELSNALGYTDSGLTAGATYSYRIKARSYAGSSGYSNVATVTTPLAGSTLPTTGMRLWLQADRGYVMGGGEALAVWEDQSPLHKNITQTTIGQQPVVVANQINGQPVVRFDGTNDYFDLPNPMAGATAGEVFVDIKGGTGSFSRSPGTMADGWGQLA